MQKYEISISYPKLANQILLFHFETVGAVLGLQNYMNTNNICWTLLTRERDG